MSNRLVDILKSNSKEELIQLINEAEYQSDKESELFCFFADPADHSLSPYIYNNAFKICEINAVYFPSEIPRGDISQAIDKMKRFGIKGANISMPHKETVLELLDTLDETAKISGTVNTIVNNEGRLTGYNTDSIGAMKALKNVGVNIKGEKALLFGLGGAGKAILAGLINEGADEISVFVREPNRKEFVKYIEELNNPTVSLHDLNDSPLLWQRIQASSIMINSTSVGMGETEGQSFIYDETFLHNKLAVMDIIYEPKETRLLELAKAAGCRKAMNGISMLWFQAEAAFKLYTGKELPKSIQNILEL